MPQHRKQRPPSKRAYQAKRRRVATSHRAVPQRAGARRAEPVPSLRPRYGRIASLGAALSITAIAVASLIGIIPDLGDVPASTNSKQSAQAQISKAQAVAMLLPSAASQSAVVGATPSPEAIPAPTNESTQTPPAVAPAAIKALPRASGQGRRVVFSISSQRVWLVSDSGQTKETYLVSGSLTNNLKPGTYAVYSRSRHAVGIDDSGEMEYFVRFTKGERAPIGFHSIPTKDGRPLQSIRQLGTPQSHGCIRQKLSDAMDMWDFATDGTKVVVTA